MLMRIPHYSIWVEITLCCKKRREKEISSVRCVAERVVEVQRRDYWAPEQKQKAA